MFFYCRRWTSDGVIFGGGWGRWCCVCWKLKWIKKSKVQIGFRIFFTKSLNLTWLDHIQFFQNANLDIGNLCSELLNLSIIKMITNYFDVGGSVILAHVYNQKLNNKLLLHLRVFKNLYIDGVKLFLPTQLLYIWCM